MGTTERRLIETFFRHMWLVLLPAILLPGIVVPVVFRREPPPYESRASVWVEHPTYLRYSEDPDRLTTPANEHGGRLAELLRTESFRRDVALRTGLAPLVETPEGMGKLEKQLKRDLALIPDGEHLLVIRARAASPTLAKEIVQATLDTFRERLAQDRTHEAQVAIAFYEGRLRSATGDTPVDRVRNALENARYDYAVAQQEHDLLLRVVDAPREPEGRVRSLSKQMVVMSIVSIITGLTLSGLLLFALYRMDNAVRSPEDLLADSVVGLVPLMPALSATQIKTLSPRI